MPHSDPPPSMPPTLENLDARVSAMIGHVERAKREAAQAKLSREPLTRGERLVALFLGAMCGSALATVVVGTLVVLGVVLGRR